MKHIWWINHHAVPPIVPGGTRHYSLAKEIMNHGDYKVTIINGSFDHLTPHFEEAQDGDRNSLLQYCGVMMG